MASDKLGPTETNGNGNGKGLMEENNLTAELEQTLIQSESTPEESEEFVKQAQGVMDIPQKTLEAFDGDDLRARVFFEKYALRDMTGKIVEHKPEDMWHRVAREMASAEKTKELKAQWEDNFYWLLSNFKFIPGGRILFGAGQQRRATLLNCYYMPIKEDSIEGIFEWCKEAARTYSFGGGVGTDISILRPKGAPVNNSAIYSTGAVSFMELLSTTT
ncbi:MAG: hypothetical protein KAJ31_09520, partial [Deltaproteobacteria bacterium]|nr:hypothetical protein [Deltaproteobacteria bacterium]